MAWFFNGRKYWYHNGKRYSRRIKRKFKRGKWVKVNYSLSRYKKNEIDYDGDFKLWSQACGYSDPFKNY